MPEVNPVGVSIHYRITKPHKRGCNAVRYVAEGKWPHPWFYRFYKGNDFKHGLSSGENCFERCDKNGRRMHKHGNYWLAVRCNCTDCPAEMLICLDDLLKLVPPA